MLFKQNKRYALLAIPIFLLASFAWLVVFVPTTHAQTCTDPDGGFNKLKPATCTDGSPAGPLQDECLWINNPDLDPEKNNIFEWACSSENLCQISPIFACPTNTVCVDAIDPVTGEDLPDYCTSQATTDVTIANLNLEVNWPSIPLPGGAVSLNELVEGDQSPSLGILVRFIYGLAIWIGGLIAFIMFVYVGVAYLLSGANPGLRTRAKEGLKKVFIGMAILFGAVIILNLIDPRLTNLEDPSLRTLTGGFDTANISGKEGQEYAAIPFMSNEDAEKDPNYGFCFNQNVTGLFEFEIQRCLEDRGAIIIISDDDTQTTCAGACMLLANDEPYHCRDIGGDKDSCKSAWIDMNPGGGACQATKLCDLSSLSSGGLKDYRANEDTWDFKNPLCSGNTAEGGVWEGRYEKACCKECSPDDKDFFGDQNLVCGECVAGYVELAMDTRYEWQACFCK